mgnify:CR=1 FL=1
MTFDALEAYRRMYLIRKVEDAIAERYHEGKMRLPVHLSQGQEAGAVALAMAMRPGDKLYASHRSHHPYLALGGSVERLIAELYGRPEGATGGWGGSMYLFGADVGFGGSFAVVGDCISVGLGAAWAFHLDTLLGASDEGRAAWVLFGDSAPEAGQFWEALNFAALHKLPVVFICENNGIATQTPQAQRQPPPAIWQRVAPWMSSQHVSDRQGVEAVYNCIMAARESAPAFVEIQTYRYREHVGPNASPEHDVTDAIKTDPLQRLENQLIANFAGVHKLKPIWAVANEAIMQAFEKAEAAVMA